MNKYIFCLWLVGKLKRRKMTLSEIREDWDKSYLNEDRKPLGARTFQRYRECAEMIFNVIIECDKSTNSYFIKDKSSVDEWLVSALRVRHLSNMVNHSALIQLEDSPSGSENLDIVLQACINKKSLSLTYKSPYQPAKHITCIPLFVRLYKQRWYVVTKPTDKDYFSVLALERMLDIEEQNAPQNNLLPKEIKPEEFFKNSFGIICGDNPVKIVVRAFWPQNQYLIETPLHHSQKVLDSTKNWTDFELYLSPTYDLKQELLWNRDKLAVISPQWLKDEVIDILERMINSYRTGLPFCKDE
ncbi:MAG: WYL domain-containing protein [Muribaculaceae bacterium]|nr:WYL domain-containing protein [Muribaculaceae bacterium]